MGLLSRLPVQVPEASQSPTHLFKSLGVKETVAKNLFDHFGVQTPTASQQSFIPALLAHSDVILKDITGSGKTLGLCLSILSKSHPSISTRRNATSEVLFVINSSH
jgi:superfamily II DNA/RNA helicase